MKSIVTVILLLVLGQTVLAQQNDLNKLSERHRKRLEKIQDSVRWKQHYKKYSTKDSLKSIVEKSVKHSVDKKLAVIPKPAIQIPRDSINKDSIATVAKLALKEKVTNRVPVPVDSSALKNALQSKVKGTVPVTLGMDSARVRDYMNEIKQKGKDHASEALGFKVPQNIKLDSATIKDARDKAHDQAKQKLTKAVTGFSTKAPEVAQTKSMLSEADKLKQQSIKQQVREKVVSQAREQVFKEPEKLQAVQAKAALLKKKYRSLPNSNDKSTAVKRTSLKGEPLRKRVIIGGNFNVIKVKPVVIDCSPVVSYRITTLFEAGVLLTYRTQFSKSNKTIRASTVDFGYGIFTNHMLYRNFFGQLEFENMKIGPKPNYENSTTHWEQSLLIGIGRHIKIAPWLSMRPMVMFDLTHNNRKQIHPSPVIFKTGIRLGK